MADQKEAQQEAKPVDKADLTRFMEAVDKLVKRYNTVAYAIEQSVNLKDFPVIVEDKEAFIATKKEYAFKCFQVKYLELCELFFQ